MATEIKIFFQSFVVSLARVIGACVFLSFKFGITSPPGWPQTGDRPGHQIKLGKYRNRCRQV
jgi:hypothetical protein